MAIPKKGSATVVKETVQKVVKKTNIRKTNFFKVTDKKNRDALLEDEVSQLWCVVFVSKTCS